MDIAAIETLKAMHVNFKGIYSLFGQDLAVYNILEEFETLLWQLKIEDLTATEFSKYTRNAQIWTANNEDVIQKLKDVWEYLDLLNEEGVFSEYFRAFTGPDAFVFFTADLDKATVDCLESIGAIDIEKVIEYRSGYIGDFKNGYYDNRNAEPIDVGSLKPPILDIVSVEELLAKQERFSGSKGVQQKI